MATSIPLLETLQITLSSSGVTELAFNRPTRYNALSPLAYRDWLAAIQWAARCDAVKVVVMTGRGKYYTSGQELQEPDNSPKGEEFNKKRRLVTKTLVDELINFPKLLIAGVNGNAIGFGVTTLALFDVVYSIPQATFTTPFMKLAFCAEGCSSILFPRIMGVSRANEMLLLGRTFTAEELVDCGFISRTIPAEDFHKEVLAIAHEAAKFSSEAIAVSKKLIRDVDRQVLLQVNEVEMARLSERMKSKDSQDALNKFVEENKRKKAAKSAKQQQQQQQQSKL
ncbi:ClpP/crotonase-like domain-containing protein [Gilbertella persicaria]|uniref:ClpP/crotonase-like domain-containing protein n=1 Tax=Gilbertella persicaria TaxID=101096 RepID=UPI0022209CB8|nr:ClpP/crotonase-like domain-containing protein [Gilbertella persicaria]KAI8075872.1 ClpP/crotonase-like domain-containing protein [Gilbertella persicaria]